MFIVGVKLYDARTGCWSKTYSYSAVEFICAGEHVIVPTGDYFAVGHVVGSKKWDAEKHREQSWYKPVKAIVTVLL